MAEMEAGKSEKSALLLRIAKLREENETVKSMLSMGKDVAQLHGMIDHAVEEGGRHESCKRFPMRWSCCNMRSRSCRRTL